MTRPSTQKERELLAMLRESHEADAAVVYVVDVGDDDERASLAVINIQSNATRMQLDTRDLGGILELGLDLIRRGSFRTVEHERPSEPTPI